MHCSRIHTVRCSGCLMGGGGVCLPRGGICLGVSAQGGICLGVCLPRNGGLPREGVCPEGSVCLGDVCLSAWWGVSAQGVSACLSGGCLPRASAQGGVCPGAVCLEGVCLSAGGVYTSPTLWTEFLTHACENITFPQLLLRTVKRVYEQGRKHKWCNLWEVAVKRQSSVTHESLVLRSGFTLLKLNPSLLQ